MKASLMRLYQTILFTVLFNPYTSLSAVMIKLSPILCRGLLNQQVVIHFLKELCLI